MNNKRQGIIVNLSFLCYNTKQLFKGDVMQEDLKLIKKYYGENMMHLVRDLFPTILEEEGKLFEIIDSKYAHSKSLYNDIVDSGLEEKFKSYIYCLYDVEQKEIVVNKKPFELMAEAGYILYECNTESDIQNFKKYYEKDLITSRCSVFCTWSVFTECCQTRYNRSGHISFDRFLKTDQRCPGRLGGRIQGRCSLSLRFSDNQVQL